MAQHVAIRDDKGLGLDQIRKIAPSVFAESAHDRVSDKYGFVPTVSVVEGLIGAGLCPVYASQTRTRGASRLGHAKHLLRFRPVFAPTIAGQAVPEVVLVNSHDGSSGFRMFLGMFRFVCGNGMIVADSVLGAVSVAHRTNAVDVVNAKSLELLERSSHIADRVEVFQSVELSPSDATRFAHRAAAIRWGQALPAGLDPVSLLEARREEDAARNLWSVLNTIQENLVKGGVNLARTGRRSSTRALRSTAEDVRVNAQLWSAADEYLNEREELELDMLEVA